MAVITVLAASERTSLDACTSTKERILPSCCRRSERRRCPEVYSAIASSIRPTNSCAPSGAETYRSSVFLVSHPLKSFKVPWPESIEFSRSRISLS